MARTIKCSSCGAMLNLGESWTHPKAKCSKCNAVLDVPPAAEIPMPKPPQDKPHAATLSAPPTATNAPVTTETKSYRKVIVAAIAATFTVGFLFCCCAASVVFWMFPRAHGVLPQVFQTERAGPEIVRHPWWRVQMDEAKACRIISAIQATSANRKVRRPALHIFSDGTTRDDDESEMRGDRGNDAEWTLLGRGDGVWIGLEAGQRVLSWDEARGALKTMLDRAYNSETKFRKTGVGDGQLDMLDNMKVPDQ